VTIGATVEFLRNGTVTASTAATTATITFTDPDAPANGVVQYSARQIVNNEVSAASSTGVTIDTAPPIVTIDLLPPQRDPTNASNISFKFTLSESGTNFDAADISLNGSTANVSLANITVSGSGPSYIVLVI
jgi:hypothetical protein